MNYDDHDNDDEIRVRENVERTFVKGTRKEKNVYEKNRNSKGKTAHTVL